MGLSPEIHSRLMTYHWPGNVRELANLLEHACIRSRYAMIREDHLPTDFRKHAVRVPGADSENSTFEIEAIKGALLEAGWNKSQAARILGISRRTIYRKMDKYGITLSV